MHGRNRILDKLSGKRTEGKLCVCLYKVLSKCYITFYSVRVCFFVSYMFLLIKAVAETCCLYDLFLVRGIAKAHKKTLCARQKNP